VHLVGFIIRINFFIYVGDPVISGKWNERGRLSWHKLGARIRTEPQFRPDPARKLSENLYDIYHCCVYSEELLMMDRGTVRNMQFYSKSKFEKLVHLVGFIIRIHLSSLLISAYTVLCVCVCVCAFIFPRFYTNVRPENDRNTIGTCCGLTWRINIGINKAILAV